MYTYALDGRTLYGNHVYCEATAVKLSVLPVCSIFGYDGSAAEDVLYVNWLNMVRAGLVGLEYFTPGSNKWRQVMAVMVMLSEGSE